LGGLTVPIPESPSGRDLYYHGVDCLDTAYKALGDAADDLRGIAPQAFAPYLAEAKRAINLAKDLIGA